MMITVSKSVEATDVARRVIDVLYSEFGKKNVEFWESLPPRDGSDEGMKENNAFDRGFSAAREVFDVSVEELDLISIVKAVFPDASCAQEITVTNQSPAL